MPFAVSVRRLAAAVLLLVTTPLIAGEPVAGEPPGDARVLTGTVTDAAGAPVVGAVVRPQREGGNAPAAAPVETDAGGRFALRFSERPSRPGLFVTHPDGPAAGFAAAEPEPPADAPRGFNAQSNAPWPPVAVTLRPGIAVNVAVTGADGAPVAGATAEVLAGQYGMTAVATAETAADGTARLFVPAGSGRITALALKDGAGLDARELTPEEEAEEVAAPLTLGGAFAATLTARDPRGEPVPGVMLKPWTVDRAAWATRAAGAGGRSDANLSGAKSPGRTTGADGTATFAYLPTDFAGYLSFLARSETHHAPRSPSLRSAAPTTELIVPMVPQTTLSGRATDAAGAPVAGANLHLEGAGAQFSHRSHVTTDADGRWSETVPTAQLYTVSVEGEDRTAAPRVVVVPGLAPDPAAPFGVPADDPDAPKVSPGGVETVEPITGVDLVLEPGVLVSGTVREAAADGSPGDPAAEESILIAWRTDNVTVPGHLAEYDFREPGSVSPDLMLRRTTDAEGRYSIRLGTGDWSIRADHKIGEPSLTIAPGDAPERTLDLTIPPREKQFDLTVTVLDAAGEPVPGALVEGEYWGDMNHIFLGFQAVPTGPGGVLTASRTDGPLVLCVEAPDETAAGWADLDADATAVTVTLSPTGAIAGRLTNADDEPLMGAQVRAALRVPQDAEGSIWSNRFGGVATTGPDGAFLIAGLPTGRELDVQVNESGEGGRSVGIQSAVPLAGKTVTAAPVWVDHSGATLKWQDRRSKFTPELVGTLAERARSAFARRPRADERLPALSAAAAEEGVQILAILADPADSATIALWETFAADEPARTAAGERFVTIYRPIGSPVGPDPRTAWDWTAAPAVTPETPGPILAVLGETDGGRVRVRAAVSLAGLAPADAAARIGAFLRGR